MLKLLPLLVVLIASPGGVARATEPFFLHPGLLHSRDDLTRMQHAIAVRAEPIYAGFEKLRAHPASQPTYVSRGAAEEIGRNPSVNHAQFDADANAAYQCALMWCLTGERAFADTAKTLVNAWSDQLQRVTGADAVLMAGLGPFKLINAAELLRHTDAGWSDAEAGRTEDMLRRAIYPALRDFALFANGNWDTAAIKTLLAIGVFCNDRLIYERALRYYVAGAGNGRLTHYIINETGQCQESGRDMGHTQLGLAHLGDACEIAWNQGLDLYSYADNRLLKGFEYTARYNLGEDVPFAATLDRTGKYHHRKISPIGRGALRPVFEQIYHHYVHRAGLAAPWTQQAAEKLRPEGASRPVADHPGFGTLLFTRPRPGASDQRESRAAPPRPPAALLVQRSSEGNFLTWIPSVGATHYIVHRVINRTWSTLAPRVTAPGFVDVSPPSDPRTSYWVTAVNDFGESAFKSYPADLGLLAFPSRRGKEAMSTSVPFNGNASVFEASGGGIGGHRDDYSFQAMAVDGDCSQARRFEPPLSSQRSQFGVMLRETHHADSAHAALIVSAEPSGESERPHWRIRFLAREQTGAATVTIAEVPLQAPEVSYGRLVGGFALALKRHGQRITASLCLGPEGNTWTTIGAVDLPLKSQALLGAAAASRLPGVTTTLTLEPVFFQLNCHDCRHRVAMVRRNRRRRLP